MCVVESTQIIDLFIFCFSHVYLLGTNNSIISSSSLRREKSEVLLLWIIANIDQCKFQVTLFLHICSLFIIENIWHNPLATCIVRVPCPFVLAQLYWCSLFLKHQPKSCSKKQAHGMAVLLCIPRILHAFNNFTVAPSSHPKYFTSLYIYCGFHSTIQGQLGTIPYTAMGAM